MCVRVDIPLASCQLYDWALLVYILVSNNNNNKSYFLITETKLIFNNCSTFLNPYITSRSLWSCSFLYSSLCISKNMKKRVGLSASWADKWVQSSQSVNVKKHFLYWTRESEKALIWEQLGFCIWRTNCFKLFKCSKLNATAFTGLR